PDFVIKPNRGSGGRGILVIVGRGAGDEEQQEGNPKSQIRNPKEIQCSKSQAISNLGFRICSGFRILDFGFRESCPSPLLPHSPSPPLQFLRHNGETISMEKVRQHVSDILSGMYSLGGRPDEAFL